MTEGKPFYDNPGVQEQYFAHRARPDNPNDVLERPLFLELVGNLGNLDIVDLGCGDASFGKEALLQGARSYTGIEVSRAMVDIAQQKLIETSGKIYHEGIETWRSQAGQANLVTSRLALNYVENLEPVFQQVNRALRPSGRVVISVEHPVITSSFESLARGRRTTWLVDNYFKPGPRFHTWLGHKVTKYHRTLEEYLDLFTNAGFELERIRESCPKKENFLCEEEYERRSRIPLFLLIAVRKSQELHGTIRTDSPANH
ncbi:class I SAM-dependent methyltransferase [Romeria aff. gracilis LEGE 07310]|uniref:Class I SAM-dependent methyltransferase n=1 Tax=Vasconcelosia minhoensis LEGE 07310 TaxID=915328 RepID=A0A8J7AR66_9CYAN|nr:class I SAM-dependent methyltransferase [Romeria gracilis]MBE9079074.1 class I SAM-dependent methyltransferase [Romeria aff. gracilis LEGE 07310]